MEGNVKLVATATLTMLAVIFTTLAPVSAGWDPKKEEKELKNANEAIAAFKKKDASLKTFFDKAHAYVVFPKIAKGGIGIGGAHGKGLVFKDDQVIGRATLSQGTVGFQLGGQVYSELIFFKDAASLKSLTEGKMEFAAQATAVAADAGVAANADYKGGVAVFTLAKAGLMYEASIGGQKFSYEPKK